MGLVAEYEIHCEALPLVEVARALPEASIEVEIVPTSDGHPPLIATVGGCETGPVERAFETTAFVDEYSLLGTDGDAHRYQVLPAVGMEARLDGHVDDVAALRGLAANESAIERIRVTTDGWVQTGRFADRDAFEEFTGFWRRNADVTLCRLARDRQPEDPGDGLTDGQREALAVAYDLGYFEVPRRASLAEVARELDVAPSSCSERLRRAQERLVETTVATAGPPLAE